MPELEVEAAWENRRALELRRRIYDEVGWLAEDLRKEPRRIYDEGFAAVFSWLLKESAWDTAPSDIRGVMRRLGYPAGTDQVLATLIELGWVRPLLSWLEQQGRPYRRPEPRGFPDRLRDPVPLRDLLANTPPPSFGKRSRQLLEQRLRYLWETLPGRTGQPESFWLDCVFRQLCLWESGTLPRFGCFCPDHLGTFCNGPWGVFGVFRTLEFLVPYGTLARILIELGGPWGLRSVGDDPWWEVFRKVEPESIVPQLEQMRLYRASFASAASVTQAAERLNLLRAIPPPFPGWIPKEIEIRSGMTAGSGETPIPADGDYPRRKDPEFVIEKGAFKCRLTSYFRLLASVSSSAGTASLTYPGSSTLTGSTKPGTSQNGGLPDPR